MAVGMMQEKPQEAGAKGIKCDGCGGTAFKVSDTTPQRDGRIRRTRVCLKCSRQTFTYEAPIGWGRL